MKAILLLIFITVLFKTAAQPSSTVPVNIRANNTLDRLSAGPLGTDDILYGIPLPPGGVVGDTYLNSAWRKTTVMLYDKDRLIEGYPMRYNIKTDELEVKAPNGIKVLQGSKVKSFVWIDSITKMPTYFVNAKEYMMSDNAALSGFMEVISESAIAALSKTSYVIKKADYVVQFDVGNRDDTILKKKDLYYLLDNTLYEIPSSKKKLLQIFGDKSAEVDRFIKINSLSLKDENHVRAVFDHYNNLMK